jgi:hypothetical protein
MKKSKFTEQQIAFIRSKPMSRYPLRIRNFRYIVEMTI